MMVMQRLRELLLNQYDRTAGEMSRFCEKHRKSAEVVVGELPESEVLGVLSHPLNAFD